METPSPLPQRQPKLCSARICKHGTITRRMHATALTTKGRRPKVRRKRSVITTFSRAASARLRRLLVQANGPEGWVCFGATLTVPGPPISPEEWRRIWAAFRHKVERYGRLAIIWRIEMQERGQPHIHCICWGKSGQGRLREYWDDALGLLGPCEGPANVDYKGRNTCGDDYCVITPGWAKATRRWLWPGAREHAVKTDGLEAGISMGWWRYVAAHASKSKQAQFGWKGRQWAVICEHLIDRSEGVLIDLSEKALNKACRCLKRLTRCRFVSGHGRQAWFTQPETMLRVFEWAKAEAGA